MGLFRFERDMTEIMVSYLSGQGMVTRTELRTSAGHTDVTGFKLNKAVARHRIKTLGRRKTLGARHRVAVWCLIPDDGGGGVGNAIDGVLSKCKPTARKQLTKDLKQLERLGFITRNADGHLVKVPRLAPVHNRIVAVELKLRDVRCAIRQARAYYGYASESYIGMPQDVASRVVKTSKWIDRLGPVGVMGVSPGGRVEVLRVASDPPYFTRSEKVWVGELFWPLAISGLV